MDDSSQPPRPTQQITQDQRADDCFKILVATDNHIGYMEKDPVRGRDSINTFKEILQLAVDHDVDMLLLVGDLFHENKPSRTSLYQVTALLREYCLNDRPITFELESDAGVGISHEFSFPPVNYEDPNFNVGLPIFSIHGNHDDPQGTGPEGALCALDVLSASGLINYFGRQDLPGDETSNERARQTGIHIKPIIIRKGETKLAMYGVGNIRDERFIAELRRSAVSIFQPKEDVNSYFNLMLIHQNRAHRGPNTAVPETGFGDEIDLILWGHEHDCRIDPEEVAGKSYYISQPGSSIATSLSHGETLPKHVGLLYVKGRDFQMEKIRLKTVRPFVMDDVVLSDAADDGVDLSSKTKVSKFLKERVNELIKRAQEEWDDLHQDEETPPPVMLPLIRLRVDYAGTPGNAPYQVGNPQRFGQEFASKVANPRDVVQFFRRKQANRVAKVNIDQPDKMDVDDEDEREHEGAAYEKVKVETLVHQYLEAQKLTIFAENGIADAVGLFVDKGDKDAIVSFVRNSLKTSRKLVQQGLDMEAIANDKHADSDNEIEANISKAKDSSTAKYKGKKKKDDSDSSEEDTKKKTKKKDAFSDSDSEASTSTAKAKGKKATASKAKKPAAPVKSKAELAKEKAAAKQQKLFEADSDEEKSDDSGSSSSAPAPKKKGATATAAKKAPAKKAPAKKPAASTQSKLDFSKAASTSRGTRTAATKAAAKSKKYADSDSSGSDDDAGEAYKPEPKGKTKGKAQPMQIDSDDDDESDAPPPKKVTKGRK